MTIDSAASYCRPGASPKLPLESVPTPCCHDTHPFAVGPFYPMLGFKRFRDAAIAITSIELSQKIRKGQFETEQLSGGVKGRVPQMWEAVLAA